MHVYIQYNCFMFASSCRHPITERCFACRMRLREREEEQHREEDRLEAIKVRRQAAEWAEEERVKAEQRREIALKQADDNKRQMADNELVKQIDRMQEEVFTHHDFSHYLISYIISSNYSLYFSNFVHVLATAVALLDRFLFLARCRLGKKYFIVE